MCPVFASVYVVLLSTESSVKSYNLGKRFSRRYWLVRSLLLFVIRLSERFSRVAVIAYLKRAKVRSNVVHRLRSGMVRHRHVPGAARAVSSRGVTQ